jgi:hypothetical protein
MFVPILAAFGLAGCTVNTAPRGPEYVAVPTPAPTVITTVPVAPPAVYLR